jgi:hypothetical protein
MKYLIFFFLLLNHLSLFAQEDNQQLLLPEYQLVKTAETIKESAKVDLSTLAILPFLNDNVKKLESLLKEKDNLLREKDAEILKLIRANTQLSLEKKECEVDYKHCKNSTYLQLGITALSTVSSVYAGVKCTQ